MRHLSRVVVCFLAAVTLTACSGIQQVVHDKNGPQTGTAYSGDSTRSSRTKYTLDRRAHV